MAITFIGAGTGTAGSGAAATAPTKHASTSAGDLLVYIFDHRSAATQGTMTSPSGWEVVYNVDDIITDILHLGVWTKIWNSSSDDPPAIVRSNNTPAWLTNVFTFRGTATSSHVEAKSTFPFTTNATSATIVRFPTANGITTLTNGAMVLAFGAAENDWSGGAAGYTVTTVATPLSTFDSVTWSEAQEAATTAGSDTGMVLNYGEKATAGSVGTGADHDLSVTYQATARSYGIFFAIAPAAAGATSLLASPSWYTSSLFRR